MSHLQPLTPDTTFLSLSTLEEVEIDPLVWDGEAWVALDALVRGKT